MRCRACMQIDSEAVTVDMSYVVQENDKTLYDYFNECTQLQATSTDNLPKLLCINCADNLQVAYNFRKEAIKSDNELRKILKLHEVEPVQIPSNSEQLEILEGVEESTNDPLSVSGSLQMQSEHKAFLAEEYKMIIEDIKKVISGESSDIYWDKDSIVSDDNDTSTNDGKDVSKQSLLFECTLCECKFSTANNYRSHYIEAHKGSTNLNNHFECASCQRNFSSAQECAEHQHCHDKEKSLKEDYDAKTVQNIKTEISVEICDNFWDDSTYIYDNTDESTNEEDASKPPLLFECQLCDCKFPTVDNYRTHVLETHKGEINCKECQKVFEFPSEIQLHNRLVHSHSQSYLYCPRCENLKPMLKDDMMKHIQTNHYNIYVKYYPQVSHNLNDDIECEHSETNFTSAQEFEEHQHDDESYCKNKHKQFQIQPNLSQIVNKSRIQSTYVTRRRTRIENERKHIEANSKTLNPLEVERKETSNENLIACKYCYKKLPSTKMSSHESQHVYRLKKKGKFICSLCPQVFASETNVKLHEKRIHLHQKREPKECPTCQKKFDPKYFNTHVRSVHTSERKFVCDICGDAYKSQLQLSGHKKLHLDRKFPCTMCPKKFARANDLKVHMRFHTGETPFACHLCERKFSVKAHLTYHLQQHAGLKRKCKDCGKEFNDIRQFKVHSYKHTGMPYRCSVCDYGCAQRDVFRKHLLRVHNMTMTPAEYCAMFKANTGRNPVVRTVEELQLEAKGIEENGFISE